MSRTIVVGSGFAGLSQAALLAKDGHEVTVIEKNEQPGGRASVYADKGYSFDMGPSWYLMPDVFERYFKEFGKDPAELLELVRLDPSYRIFFDNSKEVDISRTWRRITPCSIPWKRTGRPSSSCTLISPGRSMIWP